MSLYIAAAAGENEGVLLEVMLEVGSLVWGTCSNWDMLRLQSFPLNDLITPNDHVGKCRGSSIHRSSKHSYPQKSFAKCAKSLVLGVGLGPVPAPPKTPGMQAKIC